MKDEYRNDGMSKRRKMSQFKEKGLMMMMKYAIMKKNCTIHTYHSSFIGSDISDIL
jgi:hypothetical protein